MEQITIEADFLKATMQNILALVIFCISVLYFAYVNSFSDSTCTYIFGVNLAFITTIFLTLVIPSMFLLLSIFESRKGYKIIKYGYNPPVGTYNYFKSGIAKKGKAAKISGYFSLIIIPFFSILLLILGVFIYNYFFGNISYSELVTEFEISCNKNNA